MVEMTSLISQRQGDPSITITPFMVMKQCLDPLCFMLVGLCAGI